MKLIDWCKAFLGIVLYHGVLAFLPPLICCIAVSAAAGAMLECGSLFVRQVLAANICYGQFITVPVAPAGDIIWTWTGYGLAIGCLLGTMWSFLSYTKHQEELAGKPVAQQRLANLALSAILAGVLTLSMVSTSFYEEKTERLTPNHDYCMCMAPFVFAGEFGYARAPYCWHDIHRQRNHRD